LITNHVDEKEADHAQPEQPHCLAFIADTNGVVTGRSAVVWLRCDPVARGPRMIGCSCGGTKEQGVREIQGFDGPAS
jgi:hypothetical protein